MKLDRFHSLASLLGAAALLAACNNTDTTGGGGTPAPSGTPNANMCNSTGGSVSGTGGTLDCLSFAVVGDTRPGSIDDNAGYPTSIITKIYQDLQSESPRPAFALGTGDYQYSTATGNNAQTQMGYYMTAKGGFSNPFFPAMGNHECTGYTSSNCGSGNTDGITNNYTSFLNLMLGPVSQTKPYYSINVGATNSSWTAKFVFVAANAWDSAQQTWLQGVLSQPTTYTFVVRHESTYASSAPGVTPSQNIISANPYTLLIEGHTHEYTSYLTSKEVIVGNGGAPITGSSPYGYLLAQMRNDGAMVFTAKNYQGGATVQQFVLKADGTVTQ